MDGTLQFFWAMVDAAQAALIGFNPLPVLIMASLAGLVQDRRLPYSLSAVGVVAVAIIVTALWPGVYGDASIWPDPLQLETQIQIALAFVIAYGLIRAFGMIKAGLPRGDGRPHLFDAKTAKSIQLDKAS